MTVSEKSKSVQNIIQILMVVLVKVCVKWHRVLFISSIVRGDSFQDGPDRCPLDADEPNKNILNFSDFMEALNFSRSSSRTSSVPLTRREVGLAK